MNPSDSYYADSSLRTFADSGLFTECVLLCFVFFPSVCVCSLLFLWDSIVYGFIYIVCFFIL